MALQAQESLVPGHRPFNELLMKRPETAQIWRLLVRRPQTNPVTTTTGQVSYRHGRIDQDHVAVICILWLNNNV